MSLQQRAIEPVPAETVKVAKAAFPKGNRYLKLRDELGTIYDDALFEDLYPRAGQPAYCAWRLALVTVLQFAEQLPDREAAEAVRSRIDWKYLLGLELTDTGFDYSVLCEFRARLVVGSATERLLDRMIEVLKSHGLVKARGQVRTDSTHILAAVRDLSRIALVRRALRHALDSLAQVVPEWLQRIAPTEWSQRYGGQWDVEPRPKNKAAHRERAEQIGRDAVLLWQALSAQEDLLWVPQIPALKVLRLVWLQNLYETDGVLHWREAGNIPPAAKALCSPFDLDARYSVKNETTWTGYKSHITESCDAEAPHILLHIITTRATQQDNEVVADLHAALALKAVIPATHFMDQGYNDSRTLMAAHEGYAIEMLMPMRFDHAWQAQQATGYAATDFKVDWQAQQVTCPQGKTSAVWLARQDKQGRSRIEVKFTDQDCATCPALTLCTKAKRKRRKLTLRPQAEHAVLTKQRTYQQTADFKARYALRSGVEGTISQAVGAYEMRRSRYRGFLKTHLHHVATAAAINLQRLEHWWLQIPLATSKPSHFATLMAS
jgi:transposase